MEPLSGWLTGWLAPDRPLASSLKHSGTSPSVLRSSLAGWLAGPKSPPRKLLKTLRDAPECFQELSGWLVGWLIGPESPPRKLFKTPNVLRSSLALCFKESVEPHQRMHWPFSSSVCVSPWSWRILSSRLIASLPEPAREPTPASTVRAHWTGARSTRTPWANCRKFQRQRGNTGYVQRARSQGIRRVPARDRVPRAPTTRRSEAFGLGAKERRNRTIGSARQSPRKSLVGTSRRRRTIG